jgi:hypothetical protein
MPAKPAAKKIGHESQADFSQAFAALKKILVPYVGKNMRVVHDTADYYYIETTFPVYRGRPVMFASVRQGKGYVSYHLLPLYMNPPLNSHVSPDLQRRKQGKACFNFTKPDEKLFAELAELTALGLESFKKFAETGKLSGQKTSAARKTHK